MRTINDLPTPCLLLEIDKLEQNLARMSSIAKNHGVDLRPHCKTAKSAEVARRATAGHSGNIAVSTLHEAEYFAQHGFTDILYAVGVVPSRIPRIKMLQDRGVRLTVTLDSNANAMQMAESSSQLSHKLPVLIEIDAELHRTGVAPDSKDLLEIGETIHQSSTLELAGVMAFGGISYDQESVEGIEQSAETIRLCAVTAAERLRNADLPCDIVSIGATPSRLMGKSLEGVTEIRPGVYVFMDLMQRTLGVCDYDDIAVTVLATVIGHNIPMQRAYIDAGALALSKDLGFNRSDGVRADYGLIQRHKDSGPFDSIGITGVNQEHGFMSNLDVGTSFPFEAFPLDSRVRVLPNHVCHTIASYDRYYVVDDGGNVIDEWDRDIGW